MVSWRGSGQLALFSVAPLALGTFHISSTAYAVGYSLSTLRGWEAQIHVHLALKEPKVQIRPYGRWIFLF